MYVDLQTKFSGATTLAGVTTGDNVTVTAISSNVLDLRNGLTGAQATADESILEHDLWWTVLVDTAITAAGAATVTITLESDSTANLATSPVVHYTTAAIGKATLVAGYVPVQTQLPGGAAALYKKFLGVRYTVATGPLTQTPGGFVSWLSFDVPRIINYGIGYTIDV